MNMCVCTCVYVCVVCVCMCVHGSKCLVISTLTLLLMDFMKIFEHMVWSVFKDSIYVMAPLMDH